MTPIPDSLRPLLERVATMELDTTKRSIAIQDELRALLAQPAEHLPPLIQCLRENGQQIAERAFDAQEGKLAQAKAGAAQDAAEYTLERDLMGDMHIMWGDIDLIQIRYQWPYTDNASTWRLAERIVELLSAPAHPAPRNEQAEEWIACSERLPEHGEPVAVWCSGSESPGVAWIRQGAWYMPEPQAIGYDTITHWAPFLAAPALSAAQAGGVE